MIDLADQFLKTAEFAAQQGLNGPCVDNLFSASELLSKAQLILSHHPAAKGESHGRLASAINAWGKHGNVNKDFVQLFNRMSGSRALARYDAAAPVKMPSDTDLQVVAKEIELLRAAVAHLPADDANAKER